MTQPAPLSLIHANGFNLRDYEDLELSTQILLVAAIRRGIHWEVLDRQDNFIRLQHHGVTHYVKQATKTGLDSYIAPLIMENKQVSKIVLAEAGLQVPAGRDYTSVAQALADWEYFYPRPVVVKPKSTNFGLGVSILSPSYTLAEFTAAIEHAFTEDTSILIENYIAGHEYRYLVLGDEVAGILHRVPANVTGDGIHSIEQLVALKNADPLRGEGYRTPLEKIVLGDVERANLAQQGYTVETVLPQGVLVYLRENSNISTGGDSIDYTEVIHPSYRAIALAAAKAVGAVVCGVDMIIPEIQAPAAANYAIIEVNFNPAIHIHCFPFQGQRRLIGEKILDLLFEA